MTSMAQLAEIAKSRGVLVPGAATLALAAGFLAGYKWAKHILESEYSEQLELEVAKTKEQYARIYKKDEYATPETTVEKLVPQDAVEALRVYTGGVPAKTPENEGGKVAYHTIIKPEKPERRNIFASNEPATEAEIENEIHNRTEEAPYIISEKEWMENDHEMDQQVLTYYEGDGVLADESDEVIENIDETVGDDNIPRFGHRSNDPNIVYVRNHILGTEFEIHRSTGKYAKEVLDLV